MFANVPSLSYLAGLQSQLTSVRYAFDVIGELYFGRIFGFITGRCDYGSYIESLDTLLPPIVISAVSPAYVRPIILASALVLPAARKAFGCLDHIANAAKSCVARRREELATGKENRRDLLDQLFAIHHEKGETDDFQIRDIEQEAYVAM